ncbi:sigma-70 family RNA polymerase sigma factor [uncultured Eubacterium sp.]|uniref:sigma-70 family RNA polymerase sigma factor n=1 Tax=uncultured Eubacterium sp. TaxID=165185 RepID=UPI0015AA9C50|nr:sigma-70 family RNA polymerase sigma factor [uncultured Eubacterium sp.]
MVKDNRDEMIVSNIPLVHSIANRFRGRGAEYDDLYQAGCVGLIKAVDNFEEERGFSFSTYAVPVIMGEIKRLFRDGGAIKVSRTLKENSIKVQAIRERFKQRELREPTISELSELSGYSVEELSEILNVLTPIASLSVCNDDGEDTIDIPIDESEALFDKLSVHQALRCLDNTELMIVKYRFYDGITQCETAKKLNISQVQVSRKEKQILQKLRKKLD